MEMRRRSFLGAMIATIVAPTVVAMTPEKEEVLAKVVENILEPTTAVGKEPVLRVVFDDGRADIVLHPEIAPNIKTPEVMLSNVAVRIPVYQPPSLHVTSEADTARPLMDWVNELVDFSRFVLGGVGKTLPTAQVLYGVVGEDSLMTLHGVMPTEVYVDYPSSRVNTTFAFDYLEQHPKVKGYTDQLFQGLWVMPPSLPNSKYRT